MSKKVSIVIPVYNKKDALQISLDSLKLQKMQDFSVIVVDDGSTYEVEEEMGEIQYPFPIEMARFDRNKGRSACWQLGVEKTLSPFISFLLPGDIYFPEKLEKQSALLESQSTLDFVGSRLTYVDPQLNYLGDGIIEKDIMDKPQTPKSSAEFGVPFSFETVLTRTDFAKKVGFDQKLIESEDFYFMVQALTQGTSQIMPQSFYGKVVKPKEYVKELSLKYKKSATILSDLKKQGVSVSGSQIWKGHWKAFSSSFTHAMGDALGAFNKTHEPNDESKKLVDEFRRSL